MSLQADPYALRYAASRFSGGAGELRRNASCLLVQKTQLVSHDWKGTASQAFDVQSEHQVTYLRQSADVLEQAASVLNSLASQVERVIELQRQAEQYERASWEYDGDTLDDLHHRQNLARQAAYYRQQAEWEARQADSMASGQIHQIMAMIPNPEAQMGHGGRIHALDDDLDALPESMRSYYRRHSELRGDGARTSSVSENDLHLTPEQARRARKEEALLKEIEKEQKPSSIEDLLMLYYITKRDYHDTPELDQLIMDDLRLDGIKNEEELREHIKKQIEITRYNEEWEKRCTAPENATDRDCIKYRALQGGGMDPGSLAVASGLAAQILTPAIKLGLSKVKELIFANAGESVKVALPGGGSIKVEMTQAQGEPPDRKGSISQSLGKVLIDIPNTQPYDIVPYRPSNTPLENHHGVLDVWAKHNVPNYVSRGADTPTVALTKSQHDATKAVYRQWLYEKTGKKVGGQVDWTNVSLQEIVELTERMFDAAQVPPSARQEYYRAFNKYIYRE